MKTPALPPALAQTWNQAWTQSRERFLALQMRERWLVTVGAAALLVTLLYLLMWEPMMQSRQQRMAGLEAARAVAIKLEQAAVQVHQSQGNAPPAAAGRGMSLMAAVDQASKQGSLGKSPSRIQPEGDTEVRVWFEDVAFDGLVRWLAKLQTGYGVSVQTFDIEPQATPGRVDVRLSLVRAS